MSLAGLWMGLKSKHLFTEESIKTDLKYLLQQISNLCRASRSHSTMLPTMSYIIERESMNCVFNIFFVTQYSFWK